MIHRNVFRNAALAVAFFLAACSSYAPPPAPTSATAAEWAGTWGASPVPPAANSPAFNNQTVRQVVRLSAGGSRFRIRFSNEYGDKPLVIGAASLARAGQNGALASAAVPVTFGGRSGVSIPAFAPMLSDPIALDSAALEQLAVSIYFPQTTGPCTCHPAGLQTAYTSTEGDFTARDFNAAATFANRAFITGIEVEGGAPNGVIVTLGDSITDGTASTVDANARWPDILATRLGADSGIGIANAAISGNRVLAGELAMFGQPALSRFDRDVLSVPGAKWLVVLEGINDIGQGRDNSPPADVMIAGYQQLIARAHAHGLKIYAGTLLPFEGTPFAGYYTEAGDAIRQQVNQWIRTSGAFDGVIDFDAVMRDPANPKRMRAAYQSGDWLHPNDAGYKAMGEAVDLALFR